MPNAYDPFILNVIASAEADVQTINGTTGSGETFVLGFWSAGGINPAATGFKVSWHPTSSKAKKHFGARYRSKEGFVGVGIGRAANSEALRVYVAGADSPIAQRLKSEATFEGFPVVVEVTGEIRAFSA